jgi:uncharacterized membrane protein
LPDSVVIFAYLSHEVRRLGELLMELLTRTGFEFGFRWLHVLGGICWIGLLYYFNLVQVPSLPGYGDDNMARQKTINLIARRALWWFRWAAIWTLVTGILITGITENYFENFMSEDSLAGVGHNAAISVGMVLGILMAANVWMIIWKNQRVVLANAVGIIEGREADPAAAAAGRKATLASRQNFIFSLSMLFFMVGAGHFYYVFSLDLLYHRVRFNCLVAVERSRQVWWHRHHEQVAVAL